MTGSDSAGAVSKEKKHLQSVPTVASSPGSKYSRQYTQTLYEFGISESISTGTIPSVPGQTEACKYFSEPIEIPLLSSFMQEWFLMVEPNEATLVNYFCECLFPQKFSIRNIPRVVILHDFSGPFKAHDLYELERGDEGINYPRIQSDFVFAASLNWFGGYVQSKIRVHGNVSPLPCVCNNLRGCAVAIVVEANATASPASFAAAKNQWSSLAYVQLMERMSISRETPYVGDENICQYGYGICGLEIIIWKMSLQWNRSKHRKSGILEKHFTFPIQTVATFELVKQEDLEDFIAVHKKLLQWWLNGYLPSYIKDLTKIITAHPENPAKWITSWQEAAATFNPDSDGEGDRKMDGEGNGLEEGHEEAQESDDGEHQPFQEENEEEHGNPDSEEQEKDVEDDVDNDGICRGITKLNARCQKKVKMGKYCRLHKKE